MMNAGWYKKLLVALLVFVIATGVGFYFGLRSSKDVEDVNDISSAKGVSPALLKVQDGLSQVQVSVQELQNNMQKQNFAKAAWKSAIIEHLVIMADLTFHASKDIKTVMVFLEGAKKYADEPEFSAINHALNKDIASLQAVPIVDAEGIVLKIDSIMQQINTLPVIPPKIVHTKNDTNKEVKTRTIVKRFFESAAKALKDIVVIRHQTVEPLPSDEQAVILRINLQTKLLQAESAVIHGQNKLYQSCLLQITDVVARYFVLNNEATESILQTIHELQQINLEPKMPAAIEAVDAVQDFKAIKNISAPVAEQAPEAARLS